VAEYVLRQYQDVAFMSVTQLAKAAKVSPAGVVRFATSLDFDGYPEFKRALHDIVRSELRQDERLTASLHGRLPRVLAGRVIDQELRNLVTLQSRFNVSQWTEAVRLVVRAPGVVVIGFRAAATLAHYLWYNLRKVKPDVTHHTRAGSVTFEELLLTDRRSLLILMTLPRYSEELLDVARFGKQQGFRSLGLSDIELSPLAPLCTHMLYTEVGETSFTDFLAAPLALLNALVAEVAARSSTRSVGRLRQLDDFLAERGYLFRARRKGGEAPDEAVTGRTIARSGKAADAEGS
jgi:DNA-binding MurR/RpiR family transcriptional regulator